MKFPTETNVMFGYVKQIQINKNEKSFHKQPEEMFCKETVLRNLVIFTGKNLSWSPLLTKLQAFLVKRDSNTGAFL